jgi:hypothetical protein
MWYYKEKEFTQDDVGDWIGFVYEITELSTGKKYIGKKIFQNIKKKPPLKGKKRKRIERVPSDWMAYYGSNDELKALVLKDGPEGFKREILHLCASKSEMGYIEAKLHFQYDVLLREDYFNGWISCRINSNQIKALMKSHQFLSSQPPVPCAKSQTP